MKPLHHVAGQPQSSRRTLPASPCLAPVADPESVSEASLQDLATSAAEGGVIQDMAGTRPTSPQISLLQAWKTVQTETSSLRGTQPADQRHAFPVGRDSMLRREAILLLHRTIGNQAVGRLLRGGQHREQPQPMDLAPACSQQDLQHSGAAQARQTGLPEHIKASIEQLSGLSLDDVQVHYHSPKPAQVQALAYTQGTNIYVGPGQEEHLTHEAWHVVQQKQGRVLPTSHMMGVAINDDPALEHEADVMPARSTGAIPWQPSVQQFVSASRTRPIQRVAFLEKDARVKIYTKIAIIHGTIVSTGRNNRTYRIKVDGEEKDQEISEVFVYPENTSDSSIEQEQKQEQKGTSTEEQKSTEQRDEEKIIAMLALASKDLKRVRTSFFERLSGIDSNKERQPDPRFRATLDDVFGKEHAEQALRNFHEIYNQLGRYTDEHIKFDEEGEKEADTILSNKGVGSLEKAELLVTTRWARQRLRLRWAGLIHEASHGSSLRTRDLAYPDSWGMEISGAKALLNAAHYEQAALLYLDSKQKQPKELKVQVVLEKDKGREQDFYQKIHERLVYTDLLITSANEGADWASKGFEDLKERDQTKKQKKTESDEQLALSVIARLDGPAAQSLKSGEQVNIAQKTFSVFIRALIYLTQQVNEINGATVRKYDILFTTFSQKQYNVPQSILAAPLENATSLLVTAIWAERFGSTTWSPDTAMSIIKLLQTYNEQTHQK